MPTPRRALIIGGSLGGLLTACLLRRDGWRVDIFERVPRSSPGAAPAS
jgi:2-polyprenyl-6-methoxyphenol hydroxylase-like FAD-dependent oxidoreductase